MACWIPCSNLLQKATGNDQAIKKEPSEMKDETHATPGEETVPNTSIIEIQQNIDVKVETSEAESEFQEHGKDEVSADGPVDIFVKEETQLIETVLMNDDEQVQHENNDAVPLHSKEIVLASRFGNDGRKITTCNVCQATFKHSKEIVDHFKQVHPDEDLKTFPCEYCEEVFFNKSSRLNHQYVHKDRFACDRCGKRHFSKILLDRHLHVVHAVPYSEERNKKCPVCDKQIRYYNYTHHLRTHREGRRMPCLTCGKTFASGSSLNRHKQKHTPYGKILASRNGGESRKVPICNVCQATFEQVTDIVDHFKLVHPQLVLKTYTCTDCNEIFFTNDTLQKHRYVHSDQSACDQCDRYFLSKKALVTHQYSVHGVKPSEDHFVTCRVCDRTFTRTLYRRHIQTEKHKKRCIEKKFPD